MRIGPEGREVVGGERIAIGHCAARDDVLFGAGQLRVVQHFRIKQYTESAGSFMRVQVREGENLKRTVGRGKSWI